MQLRTIAAASAAIALPCVASARTVMILDTGSAQENALLRNAYNGRGDAVTLGPAFFNFDGSTDLTGVETVLMLPNANGRDTADMPAAGQTQLNDLLIAGGRIVSGEFFSRKLAAGQFAMLAGNAPVTPSSDVRTTSAVTYTQVIGRPELNEGLPASFTFNPGSFGGSETGSLVGPDANLFYRSDYAPTGLTVAGLVGLNTFNGEFLSFSTVLGPTAVLDTNMRRLLGNTLGVTTSPTADINQDGMVDVTDLGILASTFRSTVANGAGGDINGDTLVDVTDLGLLASNFRMSIASFNALSATFGLPAVVSGLPTVPEPGSLAALGVAGVLVRRRRSRIHLQPG